MGELIGLLFANPFVTVRSVEAGLSVTNQRARNLLRDAQARGWIETVTVGTRGGEQATTQAAALAGEAIAAPV